MSDTPKDGVPVSSFIGTGEPIGFAAGAAETNQNQSGAVPDRPRNCAIRLRLPPFVARIVWLLAYFGGRFA